MKLILRFIAVVIVVVAIDVAVVVVVVVVVCGESKETKCPLGKLS
jgi:hypothetical protein